MRVLHISTFDTGGAAKAAIRLHNGLLNSGVNSSFLSLHLSDKKLHGVYRHQYAYKEKILEYARIKFGTGSNERMYKKVRKQKDKGLIEVSTFPKTNFDITGQEAYKSADVINLHWVSNYLDHTSFWKKNAKPVVWTLHDMNPFLGIYHYENDAMRNSGFLSKVDKVVKNVKSRAYHDAQVNVVCPSKWLLNRSQSSELLQRYPHYHIPNSLNTRVFRYQDQQVARTRLGLPEDKKIILFVSQKVYNYRKGYDLLQKALQILDNKLLIYAVAVGSELNEDNGNIRYFGSIKEESLMSCLYAAADAFVMPSREDNFPNVMLESLACGTPVITFPVGGIPDVIKNGINGQLASDLSAEALAEAIQRWFENSNIYDRKAISRTATKRFDLSVQAKRYTELYQTLLQ